MFDFTISTPVAPGNLGRSNTTLADGRATIDADLAAMPAAGNQWLRWVLINFGANDVVAGYVKATWEADLAYYLDAIHVKYPAATPIVALSWSRGYDAAHADLADSVTTVVGARTWAMIGPDEQVWAKGADNGVTMMPDGKHYSVPVGAAECARQWLLKMGY